MATPGRIKRRLYLHTEGLTLASEWVILRGRDNTMRKIRVKPKQKRLTFRETERAMAREFVRTTEVSDDGLPMYREVEPEMAVA